MFCFQFQGHISGGISGGLREVKGACTVMDYADHAMVVGDDELMLNVLRCHLTY